MHPKDADGMANSIDPDQTASSEAVWSWSALFAETYLSQYIEFVRYCWADRVFQLLDGWRNLGAISWPSGDFLHHNRASLTAQPLGLSLVK